MDKLLTGSSEPYSAFFTTFIKDNIIFTLKYRNNFVKLFRKRRKIIFLWGTNARIISLTRLGAINIRLQHHSDCICKLTFQLESNSDTSVFIDLLNIANHTIPSNILATHQITKTDILPCLKWPWEFLPLKCSTNSMWKSRMMPSKSFQFNNYFGINYWIFKTSLKIYSYVLTRTTYSMLENWGKSSAGWFSSDIPA